MEVFAWCGNDRGHNGEGGGSREHGGDCFRGRGVRAGWGATVPSG